MRYIVEAVTAAGQLFRLPAASLNVATRLGWLMRAQGALVEIYALA